MFFSVKGLIYQILIDPLLSGLHPYILANIDSSHKVLDVACGTGSLSIAIAKKASQVRGIDLSESMIETARRSARKKSISNTHFEVRDATDLSCFNDKEFDVAVTSMAIHQFDHQLAIMILSQMKRVASIIIIADYNYPLPENLPGTFAMFIESVAGGEHYRNFRVYIENGGLTHFTRLSGLHVKSHVVNGRGVFVTIICD
jgi:2-polyprenyl-3-methyl-5-hydroxy-6-metoxy-1,4-benzoquinol methylase